MDGSPRTSTASRRSPAPAPSPRSPTHNFARTCTANSSTGGEVNPGPNGIAGYGDSMLNDGVIGAGRIDDGPNIDVFQALIGSWIASSAKCADVGHVELRTYNNAVRLTISNETISQNARRYVQHE